jgi:hypothetical protein
VAFVLRRSSDDWNEVLEKMQEWLQREERSRLAAG